MTCGGERERDGKEEKKKEGEKEEEEGEDREEKEKQQQQYNMRMFHQEARITKLYGGLIQHVCKVPVLHLEAT
jgi:uncharacterized membrane protein YdbT with pleckstrin-like domain